MTEKQENERLIEEIVSKTAKIIEARSRGKTASGDALIVPLDVLHHDMRIALEAALALAPADRAAKDDYAISERDPMDQALEDATTWIRVVREETVLAGYPAGDRNQTLANIRAMRRALTLPPREPTQKMVEAGTAYLPARLCHGYVRGIYREMLKAYAEESCRP